MKLPGRYNEKESKRIIKEGLSDFGITGTGVGEKTIDKIPHYANEIKKYVQ